MTEQRDPLRNDRPHVQQRVITDLVARHQLGIDRYGVGVQVGNGRRMSRDFREELQDALVYATGIEMMDEEIIKIVIHLLKLHSDTVMKNVCTTCHLDTPCHTRVDLEKILQLLGESQE